MAASYGGGKVARVAASHSEISRLRWQCRRGMRELDELLSRFLEREYAGLGTGEKDAFQAFLQLPDPELVSYLLQQRMPPPELAIVIEGILKRTDA